MSIVGNLKLNRFYFGEDGLVFLYVIYQMYIDDDVWLDVIYDFEFEGVIMVMCFFVEQIKCVIVFVSQELFVFFWFLGCW